MILGDELNLISPIGAGASAGGIAGGGESPSVSAAPGISFSNAAAAWKDTPCAPSDRKDGPTWDSQEPGFGWVEANINPSQQPVLKPGPQRSIFFASPSTSRRTKPATVRFRRTLQRFVLSVTSPSRARARDVTRNSVSLQLDLVCPQSIHKVEDNIVQSPPIVGWWCSLCGGTGRHQPDCPLYRKTPQVRLVRSHRHQRSDGAEVCREPEKLTS